VREAVGILAVPILLAGVWLVSGSRAWCHIVAFWSGFVVFGVVSLYLTIYVFHRVDWKFREAPGLEFKIGLAEVGLGSGIVILGMMVGFAIARRVVRSAFRERHWSHSLLAGVLMPAAAGLPTLALRGSFPGLANDISDVALLALPILYCVLWIGGPANSPGTGAKPIGLDSHAIPKDTARDEVPRTHET
jgi:hypothetical protein